MGDGLRLAERSWGCVLGPPGPCGARCHSVCPAMTATVPVVPPPQGGGMSPAVAVHAKAVSWLWVMLLPRASGEPRSRAG